MKNNPHDHAGDHFSEHNLDHANESTHHLEDVQNQGKKQPEENHPTNYKFAFFLILVFAIIEFFGGMFTHSLALLSDAWHMFSDVFALGLATVRKIRGQKNWPHLLNWG